MRTLLFAFCFLFSAVCIAQPGYDIQFKIQGLKDTTTYLGYYFGESTFIKDTAKVNSKGEFKFDNKQSLPHGIYFLVLDRNKIFEFVVAEKQRFTLETNTTDYIKNMKVIGDVDNEIFFQNMVFSAERHKEAEPFLKVIKDSTLTADKKKEAQENFDRIKDKALAYQQDIIKKHPNTMTARFLKASEPVKVPDPPKKSDGTIDSTFQLKWYREHFFDNFDLSDEALIHLPQPLYTEKVGEYLDKLYAPQADTIAKAIDIIVSKAKKNKETYKFSVWTCLIKYQSPEIMGLDAVYVNVYDKYFATGEMDFWANEKLKKNLKDYADRLRKSLIGKTGPNLIMQDSNLKPRSMYDLNNRYTILYIFDPDCGHCKKETPKLVDFYTKNKTKFDLEVYAVSADTSMVKMRDFIKEMNSKWITVNGPRTYVGHYQDLYDSVTTPTLYILDREKKIIGKKIPAEKLEDFLTRYEKFNKVKTGQL